MGHPGYKALLIGNSTFPEDHNLQELEGPRNDVPALRDALADRDIGLFDPLSIRTVPERRAGEILFELERFFQDATRHETLLLYYSGHGVLNQRNQLFLCGRDTRTDLLTSTAVSSAVINALIDESAARATIIILDSCYAGAFKSGDVARSLRGDGRYLLSSCRSSELSREAEHRNGLSLFTDHLATGLVAGAEDGDGDGYVDLSDLYRYVHRKMVAEDRQIPQHHFSGAGEIAIAQRPPAPAVRAVAAVPAAAVAVPAVPATRLEPEPESTPEPVRIEVAPRAEPPAGVRRRAGRPLVAAVCLLVLGVVAAGLVARGDRPGATGVAAAGADSGSSTSAPPDAPTTTAIAPPVTTTAAPVTTAPPVTADPLAGSWAGTGYTGPNPAYEVRLTIRAGCALDQICGPMVAPDVPCHGELTLIGVADGTYEFTLGHFVAPSSPSECLDARGGEYLTPGPADTVVYSTNYGVRGTLRRA